MSRFIQDYWVSKSAQLVDSMKVNTNNYLGSRPFVETMVVADGNPMLEKDAILSAFTHQQLLEIAATEPRLGEPGGNITLGSYAYQLSYSTIRHLWEWSLLQNHSAYIQSASNYLEWGGGFGNMPRLLSCFGSFNEYVIVDIPNTSVVQEETINRTTDIPAYRNVNIGSEGHGVYLVDTDNLGLLDDHKTDCFISCWALSESGSEAIDFVRARQCFGAQAALVIHQHSSDLFDSADEVASVYERWSHTMELSHLPGNTALVR